MKVMIPLGGNGSRHDNIELRYAIRSLYRYADNPEITIVGKPPAWYKGDYISMGDVLQDIFPSPSPHE